MLPSHIVRWAEKYELSQETVWEIVETITSDGENLNEIADESYLFDYAVEWAIVMTDNTYDDPTRYNTKSWFLHYFPVISALAPYMTTDQRARLLKASGTDTPVLNCAMEIALDTTPRPNR